MKTIEFTHLDPEDLHTCQRCDNIYLDIDEGFNLVRVPIGEAAEVHQHAAHRREHLRRLPHGPLKVYGGGGCRKSKGDNLKA